MATFDLRTRAEWQFRLITIWETGFRSQIERDFEYGRLNSCEKMQLLSFSTTDRNLQVTRKSSSFFLSISIHSSPYRLWSYVIHSFYYSKIILYSIDLTMDSWRGAIIKKDIFFSNWQIVGYEEEREVRILTAEGSVFAK